MKKLLTLILFAAASAVHGQDADLINADRPGLADSSAVTGKGIFQVEAGLERDHAADGVAISTPLLLRYGLTKSVEMRVETNGYVHSGGANEFAPLSIGTKIRFADSPSLGVIARVFVPSGTGSQRSHATTGDVRLAADINVGDRWSLNPNLGMATLDDGDGRFTAGLAALTVQYSLSDHANVFVDGALESPEIRGGSSALTIDAGAVRIIGRNVQLDVSIGWGARGTTPANVFWSAGISRRF